jgi:fatty acid desaturase
MGDLTKYLTNIHVFRMLCRRTSAVTREKRATYTQKERAVYEGKGPCAVELPSMLEEYTALCVYVYVCVQPSPSEFYKTVRERVDKYFKDNNIDPKISYWMFFRYFVFLTVANLCWVGMLMFHDLLVLGIVMAFGWGLFGALVAMSCTHDASHFAITHKPWVWRAVGCVHDFFHGASMYTWINQHTLGHHSYTNIDGADPDIVTASSDTPDIRRIKWDQRWMPRYFYQHIYMPMLYCVLGIKTRLQDFHILYHLRNSTIRMNKFSNWQLFSFFAGKFLHCIYRFVIPSLFMPWTSVLLYNLIGEIVGSYWLALIFQTSHVISEVEWPKPDPVTKMVHQDWAEMQVATTQDYATDSWFWNVFTGALNHQTAHHLFPGIIQAHYPLITPIVRQTCEEFGVTYHYVDTMWEAFNCHVNHLKVLGQTDSKTD